jgi:GNAT superfamily N-acetyltransferase
MTTVSAISGFRIQRTGIKDTPLILSFVRELAEYEVLADQVITNEATLRESLFGTQPQAEVIIGYYGDKPVAYALFFCNFSSFNGRHGIHLDDLYVRPEMRGRGIGRAMLLHLAQTAKTRGCARLEWWVLKKDTAAIDFYCKLGGRSIDTLTLFRLSEEDIEKLTRSCCL